MVDLQDKLLSPTPRLRDGDRIRKGEDPRGWSIHCLFEVNKQFSNLCAPFIFEVSKLWHSNIPFETLQLNQGILQIMTPYKSGSPILQHSILNNRAQHFR